MKFCSIILMGLKSGNLTPKNDTFYCFWGAEIPRPLETFSPMPKNFFFQNGAIGPHFGKNLENEKLFSRKNAFAPHFVGTHFSIFAKKWVCTPFSQKTKNTQELKIMRLQTISQKISFLSIMLDFSENTFKNRLKKVKYIFF